MRRARETDPSTSLRTGRAEATYVLHWDKNVSLDQAHQPKKPTADLTPWFDRIISSTRHGTMMPKESYSFRLSTRKALFPAPPFKLEDVNISNDYSIFIVLVNLSSGSFNMYSPITAQYFRGFSQ